MVADEPVKQRIKTGLAAVKNQIGLFKVQFGRVKSDWKEDATRVTPADLAISENIFSELRRCFPEDDFFSEESNPEDAVQRLTARYGWILDPIDGTNNYALGLPICGISLALLEEGIPIYGIIYDHARDCIVQGGIFGSVEDGFKAASVKTGPIDAQSLIGLHFPLSGGEYDRLRPLLTKHRIRSLGSGALNLAYSAIGLLDGCIDYKVKVWDVAAASVLIQAGGGEIHFLEGPVFPLQQFHVRLPAVPFYGGSPSFCAFARELFENRRA